MSSRMEMSVITLHLTKKQFKIVAVFSNILTFFQHLWNIHITYCICFLFVCFQCVSFKYNFVTLHYNAGTDRTISEFY
jgi:hypothetical protein